MSSHSDLKSKLLHFPRQRLLRTMPDWLRRRLDLHHACIDQLIARASRNTAPGHWLLDAGAGEGRYRPAFSRARYVGVDLAVGDAEWDYSHLDVMGSLLDLPFAAESFDAALCMEVLEHVPEPAQVLAEIGRVLKPGGKLYFSVPMLWHQHQKPHDYFRYTSFGLRYLLERAGFEVLELRPMGGYFWSLSLQLQMISLWLFPRNQSTLVRALLLPIKALVQIVFLIALPLLLYYLDPLDRQKDQTMAWTGIAQRRGSARDLAAERE